MRIQLVSEAALIRRGLQYLLDNEADLNVLPEVKCSPPSCYQVCFTPGTDVVIMDTTSGQYSCIDCIRQIVKRHPESKIIALIWKDHFTQINEVMNNGAKGVLSMEADPSLLVQCLRTVMAGKQFIDPSLAKAMQAMPFQNLENPFSILSVRENTVLQLLLNGHSTEDCATRLHISKKTVANHYTNIRKKLAVNNLGQLTRLAIRHKLINS